jgi:cell wall-associated NlpC family hydrolase
VTVQRVAERPARSIRRRLAASAAALGLAALSLTGANSPAVADRTYPSADDVAKSQAHVANKSHQVGAIEARLAAASARQAELAIEVARAVEAYNGARYRLERAVSDAIEAQQKADAARAGVVSSQRDLGAFAAAAYRSGGGLTSLGAILSAQGPRDLISRAAALQSIGANRENALDRLTSAQAVAAVLQTRADDMVTTRQEAADEVTLLKKAAESRLAEQQAAVGEIETQRRALVTELAAARHTSVRLERARQAGIAEAQAAAERRAEARRAAQQSSGGDGGSSGGGSSGGGDPGPAGSSQGTTSGAQAAINYARAQIGKPYQWGAIGPDRFDCSGLTMRAWEQGGVQLPHYSVAQYEQGEKIALGSIRPGDLVFFGSDMSDHGSIYHVGLYIGGGNMIEAPYTGANVRISSIWRSSLFGAARP